MNRNDARMFAMCRVSLDLMNFVHKKMLTQKTSVTGDTYHV